MLIVMKKGASEGQKRQVKQYLVEHDFDFHQSTGADRTIIGVIGALGVRGMGRKPLIGPQRRQTT